ncbi:MAG: glycosyltransferase family 2 protein [Flavobacteriales bacterium]|nr:glycosyltransferase family 2 protein [Flavobacteriales bacterium]
MQETAEVLVSVAITAYNHERFIAAALESVLSQKTDFKFEIIVGDDGSDDRTTEIVSSFQQRFPQSIRVVRPPENEGLFKNVMHILNVCRGEYIALMDGDDRWTSDDKLQQQVGFLRNNEAYAGCFHDARIVLTDAEDRKTSSYSESYRSYSQFNHYRPDFFAWDLLERVVIPTSSLVFRKGNLEKELLNYEMISASLDWVAQLMMIKDSKFRYFNETWSVYNNNKGGMTKKVATSAFIDNNILVLRKLLNDDYYQNLRHHVHEALAVEMVNKFFLDDPSISKPDRIALVLRYFLHTQKQLFYRTANLLEQL